MSSRMHAFAVLVTTALVSGNLSPRAAGQTASAPSSAPSWQRVYYDAADENGRLSGGTAQLLVGARQALQTIPASVATLLERATSGTNRIALVVVGDGYTADQLGLYAAHANASLSSLFAQEPFHTYASFFDVYRIDVISNESGVDNDPVPGIFRDTALDMGFWCEGIERLLCVDVSKAYAYANNAPSVDVVLAVANSTMYGGAGYPESELATVAGGNSSAAEVVLHELGHGLGNLADEYDYGDGTVYSGPEPIEPNISKLTAPEMTTAGTKWATWLGVNNAAFDGLVSTYEGAAYCQFGIYRPTAHSKMRVLGRPFNLPSAEALVVRMYQRVRPIDDATPLLPALTGTEIVFVTPVVPVGHTLDVQWYLDSGVIADANAPTLDLTALPLAPGTHALSVVVIDNTELVRDAVARATWLTDSRAWTIQVDTQPGDLNCDGRINFGDINPFVLALTGYTSYNAAYPDCYWRNADCNGDGVIDFADINPFVSLLAGV